MILRAAGAAFVLALVLAAPAQAQTAPTVIRFDTPVPANDFVTCTARQPLTGGWDQGPFFQPSCGDVRILLDEPQRVVELFARAPAGGTLTISACPVDSCSGGPPIVRLDVTLPADVWTPVVIVDPTAGARIRDVFMSLSGENLLELDDVSYSPLDQPDTALVGAASVPGRATIELSSSHPLVASYRCGLDSGPLVPCSNPFAVTGLAPGSHSLFGAAVDVYGRVDSTPVQFNWNEPPPVPDADADGVPDARDNCPAAANSDQADADADRVGNACEQLPPGNVAPVAGVNAVVRQLSGEVFVKLPARTALGFRGLRAPFQDSGFIPLKGVASVPIGSTVDARKGEIGVQSAANGFAASDRRARRQEAKIKAGMFAIKQARARRTAAKKTPIPTDIGLLSPPRAESACARGPSKGIVRTVSMVVKGYFRALGGASNATARSATFTTTDRCDGTLTEVGRGSVSLAVKGKRTPVVVKSGRAYLAKARLFAVRKGRRPASS